MRRIAGCLMALLWVLAFMWGGAFAESIVSLSPKSGQTQAAQESTIASEDSRLLSALSMLEEDNPILLRFNRLHETPVQARFRLGAPYFWGGKADTKILDIIQAWQSSPGYYVKNRSYLYGFDCMGFIQYLMTANGYARPESISKLLDMPKSEAWDIQGSAEAEMEALPEILEVGDLLAAAHKKGSYHIGMYIGTLRDYGYTEAEAGEAAALLDHPLLIHCTVSTEYYERYEAYIEDTFDWQVYPPDGGVIVSVVAPRDAATHSALNPDNEESYFLELEGYPLQVYDVSRDARSRWLHWAQKRP
ncbi:MAG: C40 family peptidase [Clostridia bacterium]|nr:C40 family peptidase [Clostridia bacterium]